MRIRNQTNRTRSPRPHIALLLACVGFFGCQTYTKGLQQSVARADEGAAVATLKVISLAQRTYSVSNDGNYGTFEQLYEGDYLDSRFSSSSPEVNGYVFTMHVGNKTFGCNADPVRSGEQQAGRYLYTDSTSNQIHVNATEPATASDEILKL